ncbi:TetR/AcrR family transcriptional regulator C-terminal ligand-binding domain-containing protein [Actinoplanes sp. NPDC051494]|uniref:TetR/AcrR family transcriptional regulator n=1 Tax=Actinoplanes sp. NPDC051494 TaxID=3363907 RepID=UPI00379154CC
MVQETGRARPGGRTARTQEAVHAAVRELLGENPGGVFTIAEVAARSGVHQATIYRRWRSPSGLLLDIAVGEINDRSPVPATGDLRADLSAYATRLATGMTGPGALDFLRALIAAANDSVEELALPRVEQFQAMLDAAGAHELSPVDIVELILAPMYLRAMLPVAAWNGLAEAERLVDNVLAVRERRAVSRAAAGAAGRPGA